MRYCRFSSLAWNHLSASALTLTLSALMSATAGAATYVVDQASAAADDKNPGTAEKPFKTIGKATQVVAPGDIVTIKAGIYREAVKVSKSGTKEQPITFQAEKQGTVVVTGSDPLSGWEKDAGANPVYSVKWPHEFLIDFRNGKKIRNHGADAPIGCAEQVLWDSRPLQMLLEKEKMTAGTFFVDWDKQRLYVWLPGGIDANATEVLGCTRSDLFVRAGTWGRWTPTEHITIKGITFRHAANFPQRGGVKAFNGWRVEDCIVEGNNGGGIVAEGNDIVFLRVTAQDNGFSGIGGGGTNNLVQNCISRRNNRKGFPVGWDGGGGKFLWTKGLRIIGHTAYDNAGPGIWLDWSNRDYLIENCVCYGNYGNELDWEGCGIFSEANDGPGRIVNNIIFSNTGGGIDIAESQNVVVESNIIVDCGIGIGIRAMEGREHHKLENDIFRNNRIKAWREAAVGTSLGTWKRTSATDKKLTIDGNIYDPPATPKPFFRWSTEKFMTLTNAQDVLGVEKNGKVAPVAFDRPLVNSKTRHGQKQFGIREVLQGAKVGDSVPIPANGRTSVTGGNGEWKCQVYDLANTYVSVTITSEATKKKVEEKIAAYPMTEVVYLYVKLTALDGDKIAATVLKAGDEVDASILKKVDERKSELLKKSWVNAYPLTAGVKKGDWLALDLAKLANRPTTGEDAWIGISFENLVPGVNTIHGVPFDIIDQAKNGGLGAVALRSTKMQKTKGKELPAELTIPVGRKAMAIYVLHCAGYAGAPVKSASYVFVYDDGTESVVDLVPRGNIDPAKEPKLVAAANIQDWWPTFPQFDNDRAHQALITDGKDYNRYVYSLEWKNPEPGKPVKHIVLKTTDPAKDFSLMVLSVTVLQ